MLNYGQGDNTIYLLTQEKSERESDAINDYTRISDINQKHLRPWIRAIIIMTDLFFMKIFYDVVGRITIKQNFMWSWGLDLL